MRKEKAYINKLNLVLVQVRSAVTFLLVHKIANVSADSDSPPYRSSNKHGLTIGPISFPRSWLPLRQTSPFVKTIW